VLCYNLTIIILTGYFICYCWC